MLRRDIRNRHTRGNEQGDGTQCTCFTGTNVVLRRDIRNRHTRGNEQGDGTQCTCFTGTHVQILTQKAQLGMEHELRDQGTEFPSFTGTKAQTLTQKLEAGRPACACGAGVGQDGGCGRAKPEREDGPGVPGAGQERAR